MCDSYENDFVVFTLAPSLADLPFGDGNPGFLVADRTDTGVAERRLILRDAKVVGSLMPFLCGQTTLRNIKKRPSGTTYFSLDKLSGVRLLLAAVIMNHFLAGRVEPKRAEGEAGLLVMVPQCNKPAPIATMR